MSWTQKPLKTQLKSVLFFKRHKQLQAFHMIARSIMKDIQEVLAEDPLGATTQIRALAPLLSDVRKSGERLVRYKNITTLLFPSVYEKELEILVEQLIHIEKLLKSISVPPTQAYI